MFIVLVYKSALSVYFLLIELGFSILNKLAKYGLEIRAIGIKLITVTTIVMSNPIEPIIVPAFVYFPSIYFSSIKKLIL